MITAPSTNGTNGKNGTHPTPPARIGRPVEPQPVVLTASRPAAPAVEEVEEEFPQEQKLNYSPEESMILAGPVKGTKPPKFIGVDLGTTQIESAAILDESLEEGKPKERIIPSYPAVVAVHIRKSFHKGKAGEDGKEHTEKDPFAFGSNASILSDRTFEGREELVWPIKSGFVHEEDVAGKALIEYAINNLLGYRPTTLAGTKMLFGIPAGKQTREYVKMLRDICRKLKIKDEDVYIAYQQVLAAFGASIELSGVGGNMIIDLGGGTTDYVIMRGSKVVDTHSISTGGREIDEAVKLHMELRHNMLVSLGQAEKIKKLMTKLDYPVDRPWSDEMDESKLDDTNSVLIHARKKESSDETSIRISAEEFDSVTRPIRLKIVGGGHDIIKPWLASESSGLLADIAKRGKFLTGGTANLRGLAKIFKDHNLGTAHIIPNPEKGVINGMRNAMKTPGILKRTLVPDEIPVQKSWWKFGK